MSRHQAAQCNNCNAVVLDVDDDSAPPGWFDLYEAADGTWDTTTSLEFCGITCLITHAIRRRDALAEEREDADRHAREPAATPDADQ